MVIPYDNGPDQNQLAALQLFTLFVSQQGPSTCAYAKYRALRLGPLRTWRWWHAVQSIWA